MIARQPAQDVPILPIHRNLDSWLPHFMASSEIMHFQFLTAISLVLLILIAPPVNLRPANPKLTKTDRF